MKYCRKFFAKITDAEEFQTEHGGALYKLRQKVKKGHGPNRYTIEAVLEGLTIEQQDALPYCVAWNENN